LILTPIERTLTSDSSKEYKAMIEALRSNIGELVDSWVAASSRATFARGTEFDVSSEEREDRLREFLEVLLDRAERPADKRAQMLLKSAIRSELARSLNLSTFIKRQALLRDLMYQVVLKEIPATPKASAKLAVDAIVDRSIEATVVMLEEFSELQSTLTKWMLAGPREESAYDQTLARFCLNAMDYFDMEFAALFAFDEHTNELVCQASSARGVTLSKQARIKVKAFPPAAEALNESKPVLLGDDSDGAKSGRRLIGQIAFGHTVLIPMAQADSTIGLMILGDNSRPGMLTPEEVSVAEELARQIVRVKENHDTLNKLSIRSRAQKALVETAAVLQQEIESEEIYRVVANRLEELIPSQELAFYVYDWDKRVGNPVYAAGPYASEIMADRDFPADMGIAGYVTRTRLAEIIQDTETDPRGALIPGTPKTNTRMLAVPVIGQKNVLGVIELSRYPPETFTQEDLEIATMFANHAAVALQNARLFKEVTRVRDQIEVSIDLLTHDIANFTTPIIAYFSELNKREDLDPEVANAVNKTSMQVESILRLVHMVRTMSKLREAGQMKLRKMDLRKAMDDAVAEVRGNIASKEIEFEMFFPGSDATVQADDLLKDIFTNLFYSTALSDRQEKTTLSVTVELRKDRKREFWWIRVAQPSKAIPDDLKAEVLKMAKTSKSELTGGFGIGLAAARSIISRYSGNMWVSDIVPGDYTKGCIFNIMLPKTR
jgi:GAF domain-containing protein